jgi:hypothetical protein
LSRYASYRNYSLSVGSQASRLATVVSQHAQGSLPTEWLRGLIASMADDWGEGALGPLADVIPAIQAIEAVEPELAKFLITAVATALPTREMEDMADVEFARDFCLKYGTHLGDDGRGRERISESAALAISAEVDYLLEMDDPNEIRERLESLQETADSFDHGVSWHDETRVQDHIEKLEQRYDDAPDRDDDDRIDYAGAESGNTDDLIADMFDSFERD